MRCVPEAFLSMMSITALLSCTACTGEEDHVERVQQRSSVKITICHLTSSATNPYETVDVSAGSLRAHLAHGDTLGECGGSDLATPDAAPSLPPDAAPPLPPDAAPPLPPDAGAGVGDGGPHPEACLATPEVCGDSVDNDCDAVIDEGCLGDRVWNDLDRDGLQADDEPGMAGVTFILRSGTTIGEALAVTTSDGFGNYYFSGVEAGWYFIEVVPPAGYGVMPLDVGTNDRIDSDFDPDGLFTPVFYLSADGHSYDFDCGLDALIGG